MISNKVLFYHELEKNADTVRGMIRLKDRRTYRMTIDQLVKAGEQIIRISVIYRTERLLELDFQIDNIGDIICRDELVKMIELMVDGTDPGVIEDIGFKRYFSQGYSGLEGFLYLLYLDSILEIQDGITPDVLEASIGSNMTDEVMYGLNKILDEMRSNLNKRSEEKRVKEWEVLFEKEFPVSSSESEYFIIKLVDYCLNWMSDTEIKSLLRDVETTDVALLMKGLGGDALKRIHVNISPKCSAMLLEDMKFSGDASLSKIAGSAGEVFRIILKLNDENELQIPEEIENLNRILNVKV